MRGISYFLGEKYIYNFSFNFHYFSILTPLEIRDFSICVFHDFIYILSPAT